MTASNEENFQQLITLCNDVFENEHYEAAYHLLNAGIHLAHDTQDEAGLLLLKQLATDQSAWINSHAPENVMSVQSAHKRNGIDMYGVAIRQASIHARLIQENRRRENSKTHWPDEWLK